MSSISRANLFIVGRDGNGKTSTWRSILSKQSRDKPENAIKINENLSMNIGTSIFAGRRITAIDGKCVGDTEPDLQCSMASLISAIRKAITSTDITAFVFVMKYGTRYTKQEKDAVERVKLLFGEDVFKKWGVLVFTHGDNFELDHEDEDVSFDAWCEQQQGDIASLFIECDHRYVLFNNKSQDKQSMVKQLMGKVDKLQNGHYLGGGLCKILLSTRLIGFLQQHIDLCVLSSGLLFMSVLLRKNAKTPYTKIILLITSIYVIRSMYSWPCFSPIFKIASAAHKEEQAESRGITEDSDKLGNSNNDKTDDKKEYKLICALICLGVGSLVFCSLKKGISWLS